MNQRELVLIEDPPLKCPYFTLPDTEFFITPSDIEKDEKLKSSNASLIDLFGYFDKMSDDQQTEFILTLMKHSAFQPDFDGMAKALNLANGGFVRRRFVAIAEKHGFNFDEDAFKPGTTRAEEDLSSTSPKKRRRSTKANAIAPKTKSNIADGASHPQLLSDSRLNGTSGEIVPAGKSNLKNTSTNEILNEGQHDNESYVDMVDVEHEEE